MNKHIAILLTIILLALPVFAAASTMSSPAYESSLGDTPSGTEIASSPSYIIKPGIVGSAVAIAPGTASPGYSVKPAILARAALLSGGMHSGDINNDGVVDIIDALLAFRSSYGLERLSVDELIRGDIGPLVNGVPVGDGRIEIEDIVLILRKTVGLGW